MRFLFLGKRENNGYKVLDILFLLCLRNYFCYMKYFYCYKRACARVRVL